MYTFRMAASTTYQYQALRLHQQIEIVTTCHLFRFCLFLLLILSIDNSQLHFYGLVGYEIVLFQSN